MKLTFLGTGPAAGIPRDGHTDALCLDAVAGGKSRRMRSSALVETQGVTVLIDAGPDLEAQLAKAKPKHLDAVLLTHGHSDACGGLNLLNRWASRQPGHHKLPVITDRLTARRFPQWFGSLNCLQMVPVKPFDKLEIGGLTIIPLPVEHMLKRGFLTYGYLFDGKLAYASDVADIPTKTQTRLRNIDTLVLDGTFYFGKKMLPSHFTTDESIAWGKRLNVSRLVMTQTGHTYPPHDRAVREIKRYLRANNIKTPSVSLAYDGMSIRV